MDKAVRFSSGQFRQADTVIYIVAWKRFRDDGKGHYLDCLGLLGLALPVAHSLPKSNGGL